MKKRTITKLLVTFAVLGMTLTGCSNNNQPSNSTDDITVNQDDERYQIYLKAKASGYEGTYEEWLESIKGADGASLLTGSSDPTSDLGKNGDTYINTTSWDVFIKSGGSWSKIGNIMGQPGQDGKDGTDGQDGQDGKDGSDGQPGKDGTSVLTGNGEPSSGIGNDGDSYIDLSTWNYYVKEDNQWILKGNIKGSDGQNGTNGTNGADGKTPYIGENGNWWIGEEDTGIKAAGTNGTNGSDGQNGSDGVSITKIEKTGSDGNVDTYTITFSNGETFSYTVTNGTNGQNGTNGSDGKDGQDGVSITNTYINENGDLIIEYSDGTSTNAGHLKDSQTCTVRFHVDDEIIASKEVLINSKVSRPTSLETAGYTITDWYYLDGNVHESWKFFGYVITEDTDLYAEFSYNQYTISFIDDLHGHVIDDLTVTYDKEYELPVISQTGYSFSGWKDNNDSIWNGSRTYRTPSNITLHAVWNANNYTVTLNPEGGELDTTSINVIFDSQYELPEPVKTGYTFLGWYDGENRVSSKATWSHTEDKTYSAKWSNVPMTFIFDAGDGTCAIESLVILYDSQYELPEPTRNGYAFMGWTLNGDVIPQSGTWEYTTSGATLYALWDINDKGIVPIISNDGQYVSYGLYPQTNVNDADLIAELNGLNDSYIKDNGWYFYNNSYYAKLTANPYGGACDPQFRNGVTIENGKTYWFKCEPIQWKILNSESGNSLVVSDEILDIGQYNYTLLSSTSGGKTIYASNYKKSSIRKWLNANFYLAAFMLNSKLVQTTTVINDETTYDGSNTAYICDDTEDNVFLLSYQDYRNVNYGFSDSNSSRRSKITDWAKAKGAYVYNNSTYGYYWTRTAIRENMSLHINYGGGFYGTQNVNVNWIGIRPAITIKLN